MTGDILPRDFGADSDWAAVGATAQELASVAIRAIEYKKMSARFDYQLNRLKEAYKKYEQSEMIEIEKYKFQSELTLFFISKLMDSGNADRAVEIFRDHISKSPQILESATNMIIKYAEASREPS